MGWLLVLYRRDRGGTLPFTGFAVWAVLLIALALLALGLFLRRRTTAPSH